MSLINLDNLKEEIKRKMDLTKDYEDITDKPQLQRFIGNAPVTIKDIDDLLEEIRELIVDLREWTNGYIDNDTPLMMETIKNDPDHYGEDRIVIVTHAPESLGSWKKRLRGLKTKMFTLDENDAVQLINEKLGKLNELVSLDDNITDV